MTWTKKGRISVLMALLLAQSGWSKTVGIYKDVKSGITDGMLKTLEEGGWTTVILQGKDLTDEAKLAGIDVVFLPGGHNSNLGGFAARRSLVKYAAGGRGILAGAFRSGYVRTTDRPLFPQVGATYNKVGGAYVFAHGDSDLAKAVDQPFCPGGWDHTVVKVGPRGKVFAVSDEDPVGVYGEVYGGRYLVFGAFIGADAKTSAMESTPRQVLLKMLDWLASAPRLNDSEKAKQQAQADLDFLRRERTWDWTLNERGPDAGPGIVPAIRNALATPLESRDYSLQYMSQYLSGDRLGQAKTVAVDLRKAIDTLDVNFRAYTAEITAQIGKMGADELAAGNPKPDKEAIRRTLLPEQASTELAARADRLMGELRPVVAAMKAEVFAKEREQDMAAVPSLVEKCTSADVATRRDAVMDLGRIGSPKATSVLIKALQDPDEKTRINAILALGWMQSEEAVPELIQMAEGADLRLRRRAVQALGQTGDPRAAKPLLGRIADNDLFTRENALLALGWLKAKESVPELLKIVTTFDRQDAYQRGLMMSAIRALGHIGDPAALPALEELARNAKDLPINLRSKKRSNIYSTPQSFGLAGHSELSIAEIKAGGAPEPGIKQAGFLSSKENFYGMTRRFNVLAGRPQIFGEHTALLWPYLWEAGLTGVHMAWGDSSSETEKYLEQVRAAGDMGLRWISVLPQDGWNFGATGWDVAAPYKSFRPGATADKNGVEAVLMKFREEPALHGFWAEEGYPTIVTEAGFEAWLKAKYGAEFRQKLGVAAEKKLVETANQTQRGLLKTEYLLCGAANLLDYWREDQEWIAGLRKGCAFTWSESDGRPFSLPGVAGGAGAVIDVHGPENYQSFGRHNAFSMEMGKDGEARPVMCEFYNWYGPSPAHDVRGFAQHLMHGECFYIFALSQVFEQAPNYVMWSWDPSRWSNLRRIYQKARRIREYLDVPPSAANVAMVLSELSNVAFGEDESWAMERRWYQHQVALWTALNQSRVPTDILWAETMTPEKLGRYRVLLLSDAKIVTDAQAEVLRQWVASGGILITTGTVSLFDLGTEQRKNYLLADLFGVDYREHVGVTDPEEIDTYCLKSDQSQSKAVSGLDPGSFRHMVHRTIKPAKSLGTYKVSDKAQTHLPAVAAGTAVEYDMPLGYDKVKPGSAEVLAAFANGDPALTVNRVGKGLCYFWTPIYPGLCHIASRWEMSPNQYDFWPNVRELLAAMVRGGLAHQQAVLPVEVTGVSKEVEITVRQQPERSRWMIHLLDYDVKSSGVKAAAMSVHPPAGKTVKRLFYPDTGTEIQFVASGAGVAATLRDFEVHDMVVVEWNER